MRAKHLTHEKAAMHYMLGHYFNSRLEELSISNAHYMADCEEVLDLAMFHARITLLPLHQYPRLDQYQLAPSDSVGFANLSAQ